jgi:hypothetical protein
VTHRLALSLAVVLVLAGCPDRTISEVVPDQTKVESKDISLDGSDLDILFLIDKSPTMENEQAALAANFPRFIRSLSQLDGGLPSIHIGVISQDIGAGGLSVGGNCAGAGDAGNLLATPRIPGCTPPSGNFIADIDVDGTRQRNYTGSLEDTFSCIATLGPNGCGFEQHLGSLDKALLDNPSNAGFLRPDAFLAIIIISDEDDCTAKDPAIYDPSNAAVGPLADFRCFEWGWECDQGTMSRTGGTYTNCQPRTDSPYLHHPDHFVERIKSLKADPRKIIVSTIMGPSADTVPSVPEVVVSVDPVRNVPVIAPSCRLGAQDAFPMPRLFHFAQQFGDRHSFFSLCNDDDNDGQADLQQGLDLVAQLIRRILGNACFESDVSVADLDPANPGLQLECSVSEITRPGTSTAIETSIHACKMADPTTPASDAAEPCWYVIPDPVKCEGYPSQLKLAVHPDERETPPDTHLRVQCVVN